MLEVINFMWQVNIRKSMQYYDFIIKISTINKNLYKKDGQITPKILNLDFNIMEA